MQCYLASLAPEMRQFQGFFNTVLKVVLPNKNFSSTFFSLCAAAVRHTFQRPPSILQLHPYLPLKQK